MKTLTLADIMSPRPFVLHPHDRVGRALHQMSVLWIHHLPVVDHTGRVVGLVSHRDLLAAERPDDRVGDLMRRDVKTVSPETAPHEVAHLLLRHRIGCVPVTDDGGHLVGIVTVTDFVRVAYVLLGGQLPLDEVELGEPTELEERSL